MLFASPQLRYVPKNADRAALRKNMDAMRVELGVDKVSDNEYRQPLDGNFMIRHFGFQ